MSGSFSLRAKISDEKAFYQKRYGVLDWRWVDEGLPWTIQDYHSSVGSLLDFSDDDWAVLSENGWTKGEVKQLCQEDED